MGPVFVVWGHPGLKNENRCEKSSQKLLFGGGRNWLLETFPNKSFLNHFLFDPGARSAPGEKQPVLPKTLVNPYVFSKIGARSAPENPEIGHSLWSKSFFPKKWSGKLLFGDGWNWLLKSSSGKWYFLKVRFPKRSEIWLMENRRNLISKHPV